MIIGIVLGGGKYRVIEGQGPVKRLVARSSLAVDISTGRTIKDREGHRGRRLPGSELDAFKLAPFIEEPSCYD